MPGLKKISRIGVYTTEGRRMTAFSATMSGPGGSGAVSNKGTFAEARRKRLCGESLAQAAAIQGVGTKAALVRRARRSATGTDPGGGFRSEQRKKAGKNLPQDMGIV